MDEATAKQILSAYRPGTQHDDSSEFRQALQYCRQRPELARWLAEERQRDAEMEAALGSVKAPAEGRANILATAFFGSEPTFERDSPRRRARWRWGLGAAAVLPACGLLWLAALALQAPEALHERSDAAPSFASLARELTLLDFRSENVGELNQWLRAQGAPTGEPLPESLLLAPGIGCAVMDDGSGRPVSLLCVKLDGGLLHVFVTEKDSPLLRELPPNKWTRDQGYHLYAWSEGDRAFAIATKLDPERVDAALGAPNAKTAS